jgi:hypothetical protein
VLPPRAPPRSAPLVFVWNPV